MAVTLQKIWYQVCRMTCRAAATFFCSMRCEGNHLVPRTGPALLLANHQSYLDPPSIAGCVNRNLHFLARHSLWKGWFGTLLTSINCFPVNQEGVATEALKTLMGIIERGDTVLVFPEGTRTEDGNMCPLQPGILLLIKRLADFPIVPVGVSGFYDTWSLHDRKPNLSPIFLPARPKGTVAVSFGKPVSSAAYRGQDRATVLADLYQRIDTQRRRAEFIRRKPIEE